MASGQQQRHDRDSVSQHPANNTSEYRPVIYKKQTGVLLLTAQGLVFQNENKGEIIRVEWPLLEKITANVSGSATAMLKLTTTARSSGKKHILKFPTGRDQMLNARSEMKSRWKLAHQEVSMRDFGDEDFTETTDCDYSSGGYINGDVLHVLTGKQTQEVTPTTSSSNNNLASNGKISAGSGSAAHKRSSKNKEEEEPPILDFYRRHSASASNLQERRNSSKNEQEPMRDNSAPAHTSTARRSSARNLDSNGSAKNSSHKKHHKASSSSKPEETNGAANPSYPMPSSYINAMDSSDQHQRPSSSSSSSPSQGSNLTLMSKDQIMVRSKDPSKPELVLDFSNFDETQQIKVRSLLTKSTSASASVAELKDTAGGPNSTQKRHHYHHKVKLIKPLEEDDDEKDHQDKLEQGDLADPKRQPHQQLPYYSQQVDDPNANDYNIQLCGMQCSKNCCLGIGILVCCLVLFLVATVVGLLVYFLVIQDDDNDSLGSSNGGGSPYEDDFYTRYQDER